MGMDVYGRKPTTKEGEYFRNDVWWWKPLWAYCREVSTVALKVKYGFSNDGDGLNAKDSRELASDLQEELDSGRTVEFDILRKEELAKLPRETCSICGGTGIRTDGVGVAHGWPTKVVDEPGNPRHGMTGSCNGCGGWGSEEPWAANYPFSEENVREFVAFLRGCGGFKIN